MDPDARHRPDEGKAPWQAPQLTVLGSLASQTAAQTQGPPDMGASGTIAGDSGTIL